MPIKNGKLFQSKPAAFQVIVQGKEPIRWNGAGNPVEFKKELVAEFATFGDESRVTDPASQNSVVVADIRGHFFDSAAQGDDKEWTQDEHDMVVAAVEKQCRLTPEYVWLVEERKVPAPWPTFDDVPAGKLATLAESLGLAAEALAYEKQNKNRKQVVNDLEAILAAGLPVVDPEPVEIVAA